MNSNNYNNLFTANTNNNPNQANIQPLDATGTRQILRAIIELMNQIIEKISELFSYCVRMLIYSEVSL